MDVIKLLEAIVRLGFNVFGDSISAQVIILLSIEVVGCAVIWVLFWIMGCPEELVTLLYTRRDRARNRRS